MFKLANGTSILIMRTLAFFLLSHLFSYHFEGVEVCYVEYVFWQIHLFEHFFDELTFNRRIISWGDVLVSKTRLFVLWCAVGYFLGLVFLLYLVFKEDIKACCANISLGFIKDWLKGIDLVSFQIRILRRLLIVRQIVKP